LSSDHSIILAGKGPNLAILDFYEDSDETSKAIADKLKECISKAGLSGKQLVAHGADNCSVNYGKNKSVFVKLKNSIDWPNLINGHCNMHILYNAAKHRLKLLSFDVEMLVIKVFNEFSSSANKRDELKDVFIFLEPEYSVLLRHVPTRFLSLFAAVDRLLKNWTVIKSYFLSQGEGKVSRAIWTFVACENYCEIADEQTLPELYLYFVHNVMSMFNVSIKQVESNYIHITEIHSVFNKLKKEFVNRQEKNFYGFQGITEFEETFSTRTEDFHPGCSVGVQSNARLS
jgi:hypothetical protein